MAYIEEDISIENYTCIVNRPWWVLFFSSHNTRHWKDWVASAMLQITLYTSTVTGSGDYCSQFNGLLW